MGVVNKVKMGAEISTSAPSGLPGCMLLLQPGESVVRRPMPPGIVRTSASVPVHALNFKGTVAQVAEAKPKAKRGRPRKRERSVEDEEYQEGVEEDASAAPAAPPPTPAPVVTTIMRSKKDKPPADPNGYRFRKYGKKMIGDDARHYYRCTFAGCDCKRHITYLPAGPTIVIIGEHNHDPPTKGRQNKKAKKADADATDAPTVPLIRSQDKFLAQLIAFEDRCEDGDEAAEFLLSSKLDHTQDGQMWLLTTDEASQEFRCSNETCNATKSTTPKKGGQTMVRYVGPHSHARPLILNSRAPAQETRSGSGSSSGSYGTLQDVYDVLALEGDL